MDPIIEKTSAEIAEVVNVILNPTTDYNARTTAHQMLESFRDYSPYCAKCGFFIARKYQEPTLRHFGLQLVDHYIKMRWNSIDLNEKVWIKNGVMETISEGTDTVTKEQPYIKDAVSRIVVELIKREWPQQWPTLIDELDTFCKSGDKQTELVLLIFLRLIEDVVQIQNIPDKRKKDMRKALNANLNRLLQFFWRTVIGNYELYLKQKDGCPKTEQILTNCRLAVVALETMTMFVELVPINVFMKEIGFKQICVLLDDNCLRNQAALCILNIMESQQHPDDKQQLNSFFEVDVLFSATIAFLNSALDVYDVQQCLFLKLLCQIFVTLSLVLNFPVPKDSTVSLPKNFITFLECNISFMQHPSQASLHGQTMLLNILRSPVVKTSDSFNQLIPPILKLEMEKLIKIENQFKGFSSTWKFAFEADDDDDLQQMFYALRLAVVENLKEISKLEPRIAFLYGRTLVQSLLAGENFMPFSDIEFGKNHSLYWKALVAYWEPLCYALSKIFQSGNISFVQEFSVEGLELLNQLLNFNCEDPVVLSYVLSCISNLFLFVQFSESDHCSKVLDKIFVYLTYEDNKGNFYEVKNLKRHASSLLIKLSSNYAMLLLPHFDCIYKRICELSSNSEDPFFSFDNRIALAEAIILLTNEFCDYERQSYFLQEILSPIGQLWMSDEIQMGISTPENFISFLGIDVPFNAHSEDHSLSKGASIVKFCLNMFNAALRRCSYPKDSDKAKKGNFSNPLSQTFNTVYYKNPTAPYIIPKLPGIFQLTKILNSLYDPTNRSKIHPSYSSILDYDELDKNVIIGPIKPIKPFITIQKPPKSRLQQMQSYIQHIHQTCLMNLGHCATFLNIDFYLVPSIPSLLKEYLFFGLQYLPIKVINHIIRHFLQPFLLHCPPTTNRELMLVLSAFFAFMLQNLTAMWDKFKLKLADSTNYDENQTELEDIAEDTTVRSLSRNYIDFIWDLLLKVDKLASHVDENVMEDDSKQPKSHLKPLSPLGKALMNAEETRTLIICTAFDSLHWLDSNMKVKSTSLCEIIFKQLTENGLIRLIQEARYILQSVLHGIQEVAPQENSWGALLSLGVNVYEHLKPLFPEISQVLLESVDCELSHIYTLDNILKENPVKSYRRDKLMKDAFKKAVQKIIKVDVGEKHSRNVVIRNLAPLISLSRRSTISIFESTDENIGLCNLFAPCDKEN